MLLVVVTALLVWVAYVQARTTQRQLRAYVMIAHARVDVTRREDGPGVQAQIELHNFGQTPGYEFQTWTGITLGAPDDEPFDEFGEPRQTSIIAPTALILAPSPRLRVTDEDLAAIHRQERSVYVWGYARFTDTFGNRWQYVFRGHAEGPERVVPVQDGRVSGWALTPHLRGYTEDRL